DVAPQFGGVNSVPLALPRGSNSGCGRVADDRPELRELATDRAVDESLVPGPYLEGLDSVGDRRSAEGGELLAQGFAGSGHERAFLYGETDERGPTTAYGPGSPLRPPRRLSIASSSMAARVSTVAEPICGTTIALGSVSSGSSGGGGSFSKTSSAAPASRSSDKAFRRASWSTTPPRAAFTRKADGFINCSCLEPIR